MAYSETRLSCVVGAVEKTHPRVFLYFTDENIAAPGYFPASSDFRTGDKIISVNIVQTPNSITRTETAYVMDFINGQWVLFESDMLETMVENSTSVLYAPIDLGYFGTETEVALDELMAVSNVDSRPSHKAPGATVYGMNGSQGIINSVNAEIGTAIVITTVGTTDDWVEQQITDVPDVAGTYVFKCTVDAQGNKAYNWVLE